jgi:hypothetical protein
MKDQRLLVCVERGAIVVKAPDIGGWLVAAATPPMLGRPDDALGETAKCGVGPPPRRHARDISVPPENAN